MSNSPDDKKTAPAKPGAIATPTMKRGLKGFFADTKREMKKVNWPTRGETNRLTFVVLALVIVVATMLSVSSWIADSLVTIILKGHA
jgi:preprotein translocase SecE subunit